MAVLIFCSAFSVNADTASRLYEQGKYQESYDRFKKAAETAKDNWPLFYDLGTAAYKAGQLAEAAEAFQKAMASPDPKLQAKSLYNLGNTYYRIGEAAEQQAPQQAVPIFERSLKTFENAITADPKDEDVKFNRDLVKKKLEELKKQQEQQQKQDQQQNQQNKDQKKDDQKQDQNQQQQKQQPDQQQDQQKQDQQQSQQNKDQKPQDQPSSKGRTNDLEQMQAQILLDNLREEERNWNFFPEVQMKDLKDAGPPAKDW